MILGNNKIEELNYDSIINIIENKICQCGNESSQIC